MRLLNDTEKTLIAFICEARNRAAEAASHYEPSSEEVTSIWLNCSALIGVFASRLYGSFTEIDETKRALPH